MTAFRASYADWKVIKTRSCVQVVFEVPIEQADEAYQVLGGMPQPSKSIWCGVARIDETKIVNKPSKPPPGYEKSRRKFEDLPSTQQAGILCNEPAFAVFLRERFDDVWTMAGHDPRRAIHLICKVGSRADLKPENTEWSALVLAYRLWQHEPEFV